MCSSERVCVLVATEFGTKGKNDTDRQGQKIDAAAANSRSRRAHPCSKFQSTELVPVQSSLT